MQESENIPEVAQYIQGARTTGAGTRTQPVYNPATGAVSRHVRLGNAEDVNSAVAAAQAAFPKWSDTPPIRRARVMFKFLELLNANKDELARMITAEHGNPGSSVVCPEPRRRPMKSTIFALEIAIM